MPVGFGVLGPVTAWDDAGEPVDLKGPRHRAVLARLVAARGRVVPVGQIVDDLWDDPPAGAVSAVRTFVAALRRRLEPRRPPREPARLLVTDGPGYALRAAPDTVDAWRFEDTVNEVADALPRAALDRLDEALGWWRGPAYADFDQPWAHAERSRLDQIRLTAIERRAEALLALDRAADAVPDLDAHVAAYPWREDGWALLASALYRAGRQADALAVLRRARELLRDQLGLDPGPRLRRLETDLLRQAEPEPTGAARVWADTAAAYERSVVPGARARLESTVGMLRSLAVTGPGGLEAARDQREAAITAAEQLGDPEFTARVIGGYDVPAIWTRSDDPAQAARVVAAAQRALAGLGPDAPEATRARLLATVAIESRGTASPGPAQAAREAEAIARRVADPALLAQALNGVFMQTFHRAGLAVERDGIGAELVALAARHGLATVEILGHLIRVQARGALADFTAADTHADAADRLAARHESPLVGVFTGGYRAMRTAATGAAYPEAEAAYRSWAIALAGCGMPGVERGLLPLALLCLRVWHDRPADFPADTDWGPYAPWARPLLLLAADRRDEAARALRRVPAPPRDLLQEALWCLTGRAAVSLGDRDTMLRARSALAPAAHEVAGAGSGLLTVGPVAAHLDRLDAALEGSGDRG
ncbi:SARP family transcriptional regulator [Micromonospora sp. TSRI0369]|uniref:AfsR/SARP family transcriptional regulator n=1 Tax=Micromonospora sp. TSRI0369 TaxID=1703936 RepID=UPI00093EA27A|nr:BTAD domain-containing putative transcriptional regulator [Micromonospora sp. TSRI0369]OKJ43014.1 SARP family transcriptional regulator [Micromonospora sp. TSRI0369]